MPASFLRQSRAEALGVPGLRWREAGEVGVGEAQAGLRAVGEGDRRGVEEGGKETVKMKWVIASCARETVGAGHRYVRGRPSADMHTLTLRSLYTAINDALG